MNIVQGEGYSLYRGDCLEVTAELTGPVDAIIADLPYGTTACEWDSVIPLEPLWVRFKRLIKPNGAIVLFGSQPFTSALVMSNPVWFKCCWVWEKAHAANFVSVQHHPLKKHEDIIVFGKETITYNPQIVKGPPKMNRSGAPLQARNKPSVYGSMPVILQNIPSDNYYPASVQFFSGGAMCERIHPTQKPVDLLAYLIRTYTNPGETVLDCTMGSGTTGVAALQTGREFVGVELDLGYFEIAHKRIEDASRAARGLSKQLKDTATHTDLPLFAEASQ